MDVAQLTAVVAVVLLAVQSIAWLLAFIRMWMRRTINFVTENAHRLLDGELDIRRAIDRAQFSEAIGMPRA